MDVEAPGAEVGTSKSRGGLGLHNKPYRPQCIPGVMLRALMMKKKR